MDGIMGQVEVLPDDVQGAMAIVGLDRMTLLMKGAMEVHRLRDHLRRDLVEAWQDLIAGMADEASSDNLGESMRVLTMLIRTEIVTGEHQETIVGMVRQASMVPGFVREFASAVNAVCQCELFGAEVMLAIFEALVRKLELELGSVNDAAQSAHVLAKLVNTFFMMSDGMSQIIGDVRFSLQERRSLATAMLHLYLEEEKRSGKECVVVMGDDGGYIEIGQRSMRPVPSTNTVKWLDALEEIEDEFDVDVSQLLADGGSMWPWLIERALSDAPDRSWLRKVTSPFLSEDAKALIDELKFSPEVKPVWWLTGFRCWECVTGIVGDHKAAR
jgi:hypothetical protein